MEAVEQEQQRSCRGLRSSRLLVVSVLLAAATSLPLAFVDRSPPRAGQCARREASQSRRVRLRAAEQDESLLRGGDGIPQWVLATLPSDLPEHGAPVPDVKPLAPHMPLLHIEAGGSVAEAPTRAEELWATSALVLVVRRPGCMNSRAQAIGVEGAFREMIASEALPGMPRLVALVTSDVETEEGRQEVEAFRQYFSGDIYFDPSSAGIKALGDRQYTDSVLSRDCALWNLHCMWQMQTSGRQIGGNFVGGPDTKLKFGGLMVIDRAGQLRYSHREAIGSINFLAMKAALAEL
eukprot:TRINITY_DN49511_c0_g1_i1.p1 TRINITY_DN49511_c0_g1~~TRINITY_DN49511_c0_g1_i1.p1  ORF type:complete len:293 (-),score=59.17 TRINITY_DN49511_c0_g1_i1:369-1247(-)